jgi:hypothetical protein
MKQEIGNEQSLWMLSEDLVIRLLQIRDLGITEHLDPCWMEVLGVTGQSQTGLLYPRTRHTVSQTALTCQQGQAEAVIRIIQQFLQGQADSIHGRLTQTTSYQPRCGSISPKLPSLRR